MSSPETRSACGFEQRENVILRGKWDLQLSVTLMHLEDSEASGLWCSRIETLPLCRLWWMGVKHCIVASLICIAMAIFFQLPLLSEIVSLPLLRFLLPFLHNILYFQTSIILYPSKRTVHAPSNTAFRLVHARNGIPPHPSHVANELTLVLLHAGDISLLDVPEIVAHVARGIGEEVQHGRECKRGWC